MKSFLLNISFFNELSLFCLIIILAESSAVECFKIYDLLIVIQVFKMNIHFRKIKKKSLRTFRYIESSSKLLKIQKYRIEIQIF